MNKISIIININDLGIWKILAIIAIIGLIVFWKKKNAVWGGMKLGLIIGFIAALFYLIKFEAFNSKLLEKVL